MPKLGKTALGYSVYLEAQCRDTEVSVLLKTTSMDTLLEVDSLSQLVLSHVPCGDNCTDCVGVKLSLSLLQKQLPVLCMEPCLQLS